MPEMPVSVATAKHGQGSVLTIPPLPGDGWAEGAEIEELEESALCQERHLCFVTLELRLPCV